ncbi:hypothetical protein [Helicobacter sp. T3_23-1059]
MAIRYFTELNPKQARHKAIFSHKWGEKYVCKECNFLMAVCGDDKKQVRVYSVVYGIEVFFVKVF